MARYKADNGKVEEGEAMKLQKWTVYKEIDGEKTEIGEVKTGAEGTEVQAWNKAAHKYNLGRIYTIGWKLIVKKVKLRR